MNKDTNKKQLNLKEASEVYSIPIWTLRSYIHRRIIPFRRIGRKIYLTEKFDEWLSQRDVDPVDLDSWIKKSKLPASEK